MKSLNFKHLYSSYEDKRKIEKPAVTIVKSMEEYNHLAEAVGSRKINFPGLVNFTKQTVLHINLGTKGCDEFPIVQKIEMVDKNIQIDVVKDVSWDSMSSPCCTVIVDYLFNPDEYSFQVNEKKLSKKDQQAQEQFWSTFNQADKLQKQLAVKLSEALTQNTIIYNNANDATTDTINGEHTSSLIPEFKM